MGLMRRRGMLQEGGEAAALYPFPDWTGSGTGATCVLSNGNHISITRTSGSTDLACAPTVPAIGSLSVANNKPILFTIPAGASVRIVYDVKTFSGATNWAFNLRKANANTSLSYSSGTKTTAQSVTVNRTPTSNENVGCLFVYISGAGTSFQFEADVSVYIDGVRYI